MDKVRFACKASSSMYPLADCLDRILRNDVYEIVMLMSMFLCLSVCCSALWSATFLIVAHEGMYSYSIRTLVPKFNIWSNFGHIINGNTTEKFSLGGVQYMVKFWTYSGNTTQAVFTGTNSCVPHLIAH